jgi:hypothetical protein
MWESGNGYCGEVSLQIAGIENGFWVGQGQARDLATYSNLDAASGYSLRTLTVPSSYAGQTIRIHFKGTEDSSRQTSFVVDNVSLMAQ